MSRQAAKLSYVPPAKKGNDAERTLRYPSRLKEDLQLLAEFNHRGVNDEIIVAIEERIAQHTPAIVQMKERRKKGRNGK
ncbi:MAG: hypothetical protein QOI98_3130 [Solirubrobacteraceae bacterium]|jgi:hypothetical protein|nr:hypothetical protein [Solirubrobacteraceae bacterium]